MDERRSYTKEYKKSIVQQILKSHKSTKIVAEESGVPVKTLEKWFTAYRKDKYVFDRENLSVIAENKKLQKINAEKSNKDLETFFNEMHEMDLNIKTIDNNLEQCINNSENSKINNKLLKDLNKNLDSIINKLVKSLDKTNENSIDNI